MPVVGLNFTSISANVLDNKASGEVNVNSTPQIKNITKKDVTIEGMADVLSVEFDFVTKYEPKIGEIRISGEVLYQGSDTKKVLAMWKEKKVETRLMVEVMNAVLRKCIAKSVQLTDDLRLPPPLTFPVVTATEEEKTQKTRKSSAS